ncbi:MAG: transcriptional regulator, partial [Chitinophagaceae bacterium]|nr:transcriptional regulator [Chitinophagaceae bacterium]
MNGLKYKVISSKTQYAAYCKKLEELVFAGSRNRDAKDEIALLTVLIEKWDADHNSFDSLDPVQLIRSLMADHTMKAT